MSDQKRNVERAAVAEEVAGLIRHDLRNKLTGIRQAAAYIARKLSGAPEFSSDPRIKKFFQLIDQELDAAEGLIADRLALAKMFTRRPAVLELDALVERTLADAHVPAALTIAGDRSSGARVTADALELELALRCVIENAVEAMPAGGTLTVATRADGKDVIIEVSDTGSGLVGEPTPFRSTKEGHGGVGLPIARRISARYGGRMQIASVSPGTRTELRLPRAVDV